MNLITKLRQLFFGKETVKTTGIVCVQAQYLLSFIMGNVLSKEAFSKYVKLKVQINRIAFENIEATAILMQEYGVKTIIGNRWQYETHENALEIESKLSLINNRPVNIDGRIFSYAEFSAFIGNVKDGKLFTTDEIVFLSQILLNNE